MGSFPPDSAGSIPSFEPPPTRSSPRDFGQSRSWLSVRSCTSCRPRLRPATPRLIVNAWEKLNDTELYDMLYNYVIFGAVIFYMLAISSVFVLRRRQPDLPRPYRTWGYPLTPLLYVTASLLLLGNMLADKTSRVQSLAGLGIILLGVPAYWLFRRSAPRIDAVG